MKALVVLALLCSTAAADDFQLGDAATFHAPDGWTEKKSSAQDGPALVMRTEGGGLLAVTVAMAPNTGAYRRREKQKYLDDVVAGFATDGTEVVKSKIGKQGTVPSVDVWLKRGKQQIAVRVLLFRTRTVGIAVSGDSKEARDAAIRALVPQKK